MLDKAFRKADFSQLVFRVSEVGGILRRTNQNTKSAGGSRRRCNPGLELMLTQNVNRRVCLFAPDGHNLDKNVPVPWSARLVATAKNGLAVIGNRERLRFSFLGGGSWLRRING